MTGDLFVPSGARVPLIGLPPIDRPIRLADGRALRYSHSYRAPDGSGGWLEAQFWGGPRGLHLAVSLDVTPAWGPLLHVSVSYVDIKHRPSWEDLTAIKEAVFGDVDASMILPSKADYVNLRENCFHLWEIPQKWGIR